MRIQSLPETRPRPPRLSESDGGQVIVLTLLNTEPLNTEHSKHLLIAIPNRNCLIHLGKDSACKELKEDVLREHMGLYSVIFSVR